MSWVFSVLRLFIFHLQRQLGIDVTTIVASAMRQLGVGTLRAADVMDRPQRMMRTPLTLARLADFHDRLHDRLQKQKGESSPAHKKPRRDIPAGNATRRVFAPGANVKKRCRRRKNDSQAGYAKRRRFAGLFPALRQSSSDPCRFPAPSVDARPHRRRQWQRPV